MDEVPEEILCIIFNFLEYLDFKNLLLVNSSWKAATEHDLLWKNFFAKSYNIKKVHLSLNSTKSWKNRFKLQKKYVMKSKLNPTKIIYPEKEYKFKEFDLENDLIEEGNYNKVQSGKSFVLNGIPCVKLEAVFQHVIHNPSKSLRISFNLECIGKSIFTHENISQRFINEYPKIPIQKYDLFKLIDINETGIVTGSKLNDSLVLHHWNLPFGKLGNQINKKYKQKDLVILEILNVMNEEEIVSLK